MALIINKFDLFPIYIYIYRKIYIQRGKKKSTFMFAFQSIDGAISKRATAKELRIKSNEKSESASAPSTQANSRTQQSCVPRFHDS